MTASRHTAGRRRHAVWRTRALLGVSAVLLVTSLLPWPVARGQAGGGRPRLWAGTAVARGVGVSVNTDPRLLPLEEFIHVEAPDAYTSWNTTTAVARASPLYPGSSGTGGPRLLCEFGFPCPEGFPPDYPLVAMAQYPTRPDATTPAGAARAHAGAEQVWAAASGNRAAADVLEALAPLVEVASAHSRTSQAFDDGVLVVRSESVLEDVRLLDGLVVIESLRTVAVSRSGDGVRESRGRVIVGRTTVAGQAATIDEDGIDVGGTGVPTGPVRAARDALAAALQERQGTIRLLGTDRRNEGGTTRAEAAGLLVDLRVGVPGPAVPVPVSPFRAYLLTLRLGNAGTSAFTNDEPLALDVAELLGVAGPATPAGGPGGGGGDGTPLAGVPAGGGADGAGLGAGATAVDAGGGRAGGQAGSGDGGLSLLGGSVADRVRLLYGLAGALGVLAFAASRAGGLIATRREGGAAA